MVLEAGELGVASAIDRDGEAVVYFPRLVMGGERSEVLILHEELYETLRLPLSPKRLHAVFFSPRN